MNRARIIKDFILKCDFRMDDISAEAKNAALNVDASSPLYRRWNIFSRSNDYGFRRYKVRKTPHTNKAQIT